MPRARQGPDGGLAVVGRRDRDAPAAAPQGREQAPRSVTGRASATGSGACQAASRARRDGRRPDAGIAEDTPRSTSRSAPSASTARRPPPTRARSRRRSRAARTTVARRAAASRLPAVGPARRPAAPHRVELDERAVLVEDDQVDPVEAVRHTSAPAATSGTRRSAAPPVPADNEAGLRRERHRDDSPTRRGQARIVERVEATTVRPRTIPECEAEADDRSQEADVLEPAPDLVPAVPAVAQLDALGAHGERDGSPAPASATGFAAGPPGRRSTGARPMGRRSPPRPG